MDVAGVWSWRQPGRKCARVVNGREAGRGAPGGGRALTPVQREDPPVLGQVEDAVHLEHLSLHVGRVAAIVRPQRVAAPVLGKRRGDKHTEHQRLSPSE